MSVKVPRLRVSTPTEPVVPGRGFYQLEEESLFVQVGISTTERSFFSFIESELLRLELDRKGRLIFIELNRAKRHWTIVNSLLPPKIIEPADLRWLDFRTELEEPLYYTNNDQNIIKIEFAKSDEYRNYYIAEKVIASVNSYDQLTALWITEIDDDLAGQEISLFRSRGRIDSSS